MALLVARKRSFHSVLFDVANCTALLALAAVMLYPIVKVFAISLSSSEAVIAGTVGLWPRGWNMEGYVFVLQRADLWIAYRNTIAYVVGNIATVLLFTSLTAYALAVKDFVLKSFVMVMLAITMFFSGGLIPTFMLMKSLHLLDTYAVMVLPGAVVAFNVIVFRTFFQNIPYEYRESAFMDGAHDLRILFQIYIPLSKPLLATFALFTAVNVWNDWFTALIYLNNQAMHPIQLLLRKILIIGNVTNEAFAENVLANRNISPKNLQMAVTMVALFPILVAYPFVQKYFVKGIMIGGIKG